jgi:hypothetical protein
MIRIMGGKGYINGRPDPASFATAQDIRLDLDGRLVETVLSRGLARVGDSVVGQFMLSPDFAESLGSCGPVGQAMCVFEGLHRIDPQQIAAIETILSLNPATAAARAVQHCRAGDQEACLSVSTAILEAMGAGARTASAIVQRMTNDGNGGGGVRGAVAQEGGDARNRGTGSTFVDQVRLDDHFNRHGADFGATSSAQYQRMADDFLTGPRNSSTLEITRTNGDVVRYDPTTDAFGVVSSNGSIRTYYVPDPNVHGYPTNLDYFNAQQR